MCLAPSSSGPGRGPLKAVVRVQIPWGLRVKYQVRGLIADGGGQALDRLSLVCHWVPPSPGGSRRPWRMVVGTPAEWCRIRCEHGGGLRGGGRRCPFSIEPRQSRLIRGIRCFVPLDLMHGRDAAVGYLRSCEAAASP